MHKNKFCHRDIKLSNIALFDENIKLIDFGLAFQYQNAYDKYPFDGTPEYMP